MAATVKRKPQGIVERHARSCRSRDSGTCNCDPSFEAWVFDARASKKIRKTFSTKTAAKAWRADALSLMNRGELRASTSVRLDEAIEELQSGMRDGTIRAEGGKPYKDSTIESYATSLENHVLKDLGAVRLRDVTTVDVQALVDRLGAKGLSGQSVRNTVTALAVLYRYAKRRGWVSSIPCRDLELPAGSRRRERIVDPIEARALLEPLSAELRALYGLAIYAGLRRGEIAGLRWEDVEFDHGAMGGTITVDRAFCWRTSRFIDPKTERGRRVVPMVSALAELMLAWSVEHPGGELVFPSARERGRPFDPRAVARRAETAWKQEAKRQAAERGEDPEKATWERIILHEGRHSAASTFIAAGEDVVQVASWLGHSQTSTTLNIYAKAFKTRERQVEQRQRLEAFYAAFVGADSSA